MYILDVLSGLNCFCVPLSMYPASSCYLIGELLFIYYLLKILSNWPLCVHLGSEFIRTNIVLLFVQPLIKMNEMLCIALKGSRNLICYILLPEVILDKMSG